MWAVGCIHVGGRLLPPPVPAGDLSPAIIVDVLRALVTSAGRIDHGGLGVFGGESMYKPLCRRTAAVAARAYGARLHGSRAQFGLYWKVFGSLLKREV